MSKATLFYAACEVSGDYFDAARDAVVEADPRAWVEFIRTGGEHAGVFNGEADDESMYVAYLRHPDEDLVKRLRAAFVESEGVDLDQTDEEPEAGTRFWPTDDEGEAKRADDEIERLRAVLQATEAYRLALASA